MKQLKHNMQKQKDLTNKTVTIKIFYNYNYFQVFGAFMNSQNTIKCNETSSMFENILAIEQVFIFSFFDHSAKLSDKIFQKKYCS